jgi:hypothetical protein
MLEHSTLSLFFEAKDFVSALTLAGAAEEILGKLLEQQGQTHALGHIIDGSLKLNDVEPGSPEEPRARRATANLANQFKNRLKHYSEEDATTFSVDFYAAEIIDRAITNYFAYTGQETKKMKRFKEEVAMRVDESA